MSAPPQDERARWAASADAWDRWAGPMADLAERLNRPLLDAAGIEPGDRVLDLASGAGEPALGAARRAGPDGMVVGTDLVAAMLAGAVRRVFTLDGAGRAVFAAADMTRLPFPDGVFDRVTCRFGIMFVPEPAAALSEVLRVLRPGGRAALMVWGARADNALLDVVADAIEAEVSHAAAAGALDGLFRFAVAGSLAAALTAAGFADAGETALTPVRKAPADGPFWRATLEMSFSDALVGLDTAGRAALEAGIARRFAARATDGTVPLPLHARIATGTR